MHFYHISLFELYLINGNSVTVRPSVYTALSKFEIRLPGMKILKIWSERSIVAILCPCLRPDLYFTDPGSEFGGTLDISTYHLSTPKKVSKKAKNLKFNCVL